MEMTLAELKSKILQIKEVLGWSRVGNYRNGQLYLSEISDETISHWGYVYSDELKRNEWKQVETTWAELTEAELLMLEKFVKLKFPKEFVVARDKFLISFTNEETKEILSVNLKDKKFTKTYVTGKARDIKYPHSFFKGMDGRVVASKIPADDHFKKLVETIIRKESSCSNFGTFLVRLFDNIHLESYISAGVNFDYNISVGYNFFDKNVRTILNNHKMRYDKTIEKFFANNHDLGKSMLHFIKDERDFSSIFSSIANNMRDINVLVENYKYDVKTLFEYCKERDWKSGRDRWNSRDLVSFMCDYARMADMVFPNGFDKYPKNIIEWHDGVTKLYEKEKIKFDDEIYKKFINEKLEYSNKEFVMIYPKSTGDIQTEGRVLSHCVGSYISNILKGHTTILFLRKKDAENEPLVTVEVRDGRVSQARGKFNRALLYDELAFLREYAEKKKLVYTG